MFPYPTVVDAIAALAGARPDRGFTFQNMQGEEVTYGFPELERTTRGRAAALQALGLGQGERVGLIVIEPEDFVLSFMAVLRLGAVPVPLYPPLTLSDVDAYLRHTARILESAGVSHLLFSARLQSILWSLKDRVATLKGLVRVESLRGAGGEPRLPRVAPGDLAFLQYTSGATADPKGVMVTHASLAANTWAILIPGLQADVEHDVGVTWLPLYHDMGLIGFLISGLYLQVPIVFLPTLRFIKRASIWMDALHRHKGTVSFAPPFAFGLAARKATPEELQRWDLSHVRVLGCGAEPIQADVLRRFEDLFHQRCGLPRTAIMPAYGMAEATLAVTFKPLHEPFHTRRVDARLFERERRAQEVTDGEAMVEHVCCGRSFPGHEVVVVGEDGLALPEGQEGEIRVRGPSVTAGYYREPQATAATFRNGWLHTGDLGYLWDGQLYVTGRLKDLIILNGRNIHPQMIEWAAAEVPGVRKGNVVAFSRPGPETEEVVVVLEHREEGGPPEELVAEVRRTVQQRLGISVSEVVLLQPGQLPKTSSGKLQRRRTRQLLLGGRLAQDGWRNARTMASRVMLVRAMARSLWSRVKSAAF